MGAMGCPERVIDIDIPKRSERARKGLVVLLFSEMEAQVLQQ